MESARPQPRLLPVELGKPPPPQQRVIADINPRHDIGRRESDLLGLGEDIVDIAIDHQAPDDRQRRVG